MDFRSVLSCFIARTTYGISSAQSWEYTPFLFFIQLQLNHRLYITKAFALFTLIGSACFIFLSLVLSHVFMY